MPVFGALTVTEARRLIKDNERLTAENARLSAATDALALRVEAAELAARRAEEAPAPGVAGTLGGVLDGLKARVPTLPYAPGYLLAAKAGDPDAFAQALHVMLLHAQTVGRAQGAGL